jgi:cytochrome c-type biogenesis protein
MIESFFLTVNEWIQGGTAIAALGCFVWGMISVMFSPCHLASIPLIIAYVGGQHQAMSPKQASSYAALFTLGLFITIAIIGIVCALLGRMLGDVGNYWQILIGLVLVWVALGMLGVEKCAMSGSLLYRLNLKGLFGAFALGLSYGILSGSCTFGFIAPILAIITVQQKVAAGILFILLFAVGHCLPIVIAGSSTAAVRRLMENSTWQGAGNWFRKVAGMVICLLGIYFIVYPFVANV